MAGVFILLPVFSHYSTLELFCVKFFYYPRIWATARQQLTNGDTRVRFSFILRPMKFAFENACHITSVGGNVIFSEPKQEQLETLAHEFGHVFGLRHFFAQIEEKRWRSEIFGKHKPFSIMNYGQKSVMTKWDRSDLKTLYSKAWSLKLTEINGTRIKLVKPYHMT